MRGKLLLTFLLIFSLTCFSQDSIFHIKNYKYRTEGYRALSLDLNMDGSQSSNENSNNAKSTGKYFRLAPSNISFYRIISNESRWHQSEISLLPSFVYNKSSGSSLLYKEKQLSGQMVWRRTDRFYRKGNNYFELGNELQGSILNAVDERATSDQKRSENRVSDVLTFGVGKGRIEFVQDAQMASFILEDLQRQGLLQGDVDAEIYNEFARLLTDISNRRVFDFRRRRIYELTRIDSFLRNKGLVTMQDIRSFVTINDNWSLGFNPSRNAGTIYFIKLKPSVQWGYDDRKYNTPPTYTRSTIGVKALGLSPVIGFEKYTPTSLKWQHNSGLAVSYERFWAWTNFTYQTNAQNSESDYYSDEGFYAMNAFYGIGFYPNNRTILNTLLSLAANFYDRNTWMINPQLHFYTSYFVGYRTRLIANISYGFNRNSFLQANQTLNNSSQSSSNFSVGLSHYIF